MLASSPAGTRSSPTLLQSYDITRARPCLLLRSFMLHEAVVAQRRRRYAAELTRCACRAFEATVPKRSWLAHLRKHHPAAIPSAALASRSDSHQPYHTRKQAIPFVRASQIQDTPIDRGGGSNCRNVDVDAAAKLRGLDMRRWQLNNLDGRSAAAFSVPFAVLGLRDTVETVFERVKRLFSR